MTAQSRPWIGLYVALPFVALCAGSTGCGQPSGAGALDGGLQTDAASGFYSPIDLGDSPIGDGGPPINWGPTVVDPQPIAPLSGGTLTVLHDGRLAASDPDRDLVYLVDLTTGAVASTVALQPGDEPGRLVEDAAGHVHVVLRRGHAVVTIGADGSLIERRAVCPIPRGIAYDKANDQVWVACTGGELLALPAGGGAATVSYQLDRDLRDVVVEGATLYVSRFRSAQVLVVDAATGVVSKILAPPVAKFGQGTFSPSVAWRMVAAPTGGVVVAHQRGLDAPVQTGPGGYGGAPQNGGMSPGADAGVVAEGCGPGTGIVQSVVSSVGPNSAAAAAAPMLVGVVLPVDIAVASDGAYTVASAGNYKQPASGPSSLTLQTFSSTLSASGQCAVSHTLSVGGQVTALAYLSSGELAIQTREPATLAVPSQKLVITLSAISREDTGHAIFHNNSGAGLACASCHPEGGDDGRTWSFDQLGLRRTPALRGDILSTAPFHWGGEERDFNTLVDDVFSGRMGGPNLDGSQMGALTHYVGTVPALPALNADTPAIARGQALFNDKTHNCGSCHSGAKFTNNLTLDVGTGDGFGFQVPSLLGVAWRGPYLHDGRAATLADRFDPKLGGGDAHGNTSGLTADNIADLVAYLESL